MVKPHPPRWHYRFDNYRRAFALLREMVEAAEVRPLQQIEKEGTIQRFEYTWELAWKVMKDYLEHSGVTFATVTPATVIRAALAAKLIDSGEDWMDALSARNRMSHVYDFAIFDRVLADLSARFFKLFDDLHFKLLEERVG
jgi:nucleotidyltransferase substrate binding protein (TIGR01987 family)